MESDFARILGLFLILLMVGFYYREALKSIFNTPKESFILSSTHLPAWNPFLSLF